MESHAMQPIDQRSSAVSSRETTSVQSGGHARALAALALGAFALGAFAIGAVAIGRMAIGRVAIGRARIRHMHIDELTVRSLHITERFHAPPNASS